MVVRLKTCGPAVIGSIGRQAGVPHPIRPLGAVSTTLPPVDTASPVKRKRSYPEEKVQRAVVEFLKLAAPDDLLWWASTNQKGTRKGFDQAILKAMGARPGVHDLCFVIGPAARFCSIELKRPGWSASDLSDDQLAFGRQVVALGGQYAVCSSVDRVERVLRGWGVRLRATVLTSSGMESP